MRLNRLGGLCIVALIAVCSVAGSAWATAPEFGRCLKAPVVSKKFTGKYDNSGCTPPKTEEEKKAVEKGEGKFEWHPGAVKKFQTSKGGKGLLEEVGKDAVGCESESSTGEYSGTKEVNNVVVKFKGCHAPPLVCTSEGHEAGELVTEPLEGRVVFENEATHTTAFQLYPAHGTEKFIEFNCGGTLTVAVRGSILAPAKADKMSLTLTLVYKAKHGFQTPEFFEENGLKIPSFLEADFSGKGWDQAGQTITSTVTNEEKLELNAYV